MTRKDGHGLHRRKNRVLGYDRHCGRIVAVNNKGTGVTATCQGCGLVASIDWWKRNVVQR